MKYSLVKPNGSIVRTIEFDSQPAQPIAAKGRWLPDTPPMFNPITHTATAIEPVPANATEIGYTVTSRPLAQVRTHKKKELAVARDAALVADVVIGTRTWPADDLFIGRLNALISRASRAKPAVAKLRGVDGPAINTPTLAQLEAIEDAIFAQHEAVWAQYWARIDVVNDANATVDSVFAVVW